MRFPVGDPAKLKGTELTAALEDVGFERVAIAYYPLEHEVEIHVRKDGEPVESSADVGRVVGEHLGGNLGRLPEDERPLFFEGVHLDDPSALAEDLDYEDVLITQDDEGLYVFGRYPSGTPVDERSRDAIQRRIDKRE